MTKIKDAVGSNALSAKLDCAYIQILLNVKLAKTQGFTKIAEDGLCGAATIKAIRTFQQTIKMYHIDGRIEPDRHTFNKLIEGLSPTELTACWNKAVLTQNKGLIIDEQAKRAQATNKALPKKLVPKTDVIIPSNTNGFSFPLEAMPNQNYLNYEGRAFGSDRTGKRGYRLHAGCDLIMPAGTPVYAIADGVVRHNPKYFYFGTYVLEVTHGDYVARYGELFPSAATGVKLAESILPEIRAGRPVTKGQVIGYVGQFYDTDKQKSLSMLHFEMYANAKLGIDLSDTSKNSTPYRRRNDLMDPTTLLNAAQSKLPSGGEKLSPSLTQQLIIFTKAEAMRLKA